LFLLPFTFDLLLTFKFCLLVTFIETSLYFFIRYKKQFQLNLEKEELIGQAIKQQQVKELEVLKQQIDPHFIFNSFNTLAFLIDENSEKAKRFSNKLANVHRYIIFNSNKNFVSVADEVEFAKDYAYLQEIRHSNEVQIDFCGFNDVDNVFILPVSIQILIENAIKHNEFGENDPLIIHVRYENNSVSVENKLTAKSYDIPSSKIGLSNLRDRCRLILGKDLQIVKEAACFKVILPLLNK
jgi:LytS/YehU family sensor histidine kinase